MLLDTLSVHHREAISAHVHAHNLRCQHCGGEFVGVGMASLALDATWHPMRVAGTLSDTGVDINIVMLACQACRVVVFLDLPTLSYDGITAREEVAPGADHV